jgi:antitoxin MazE
LEAPVKVATWGNSLAVRLPKAMVESLGLKEGDEIQVVVTRARDEEIAAKAERVRWLEEMRRKYSGRLPADFKFDRDKANRRGD